MKLKQTKIEVYPPPGSSCRKVIIKDVLSLNIYTRSFSETASVFKKGQFTAHFFLNIMRFLELK